jgi:hypothetical protein
LLTPFQLRRCGSFFREYLDIARRHCGPPVQVEAVYGLVNGIQLVGTTLTESRQRNKNRALIAFYAAAIIELPAEFIRQCVNGAENVHRVTDCVYVYAVRGLIEPRAQHVALLLDRYRRRRGL